jgi:hypothetical protein
MKIWYYVLFKRMWWDEQVKACDDQGMKMRNACNCYSKTTSKGATEKTWRNACVDNTWISLYNTCNLLQTAWLVVLYYFFSPVALERNSGLGRLTVEVLGHTQLHKQTRSRLDSSERVITSSQRPLPAQHTTNRRDEYPCPQRNSN